jgi:uncharacterized membrane protein YcaP (DUF421 family)
MHELIGIIIRLSVMYLYALTLVRLSGKRTLGNLSAQDFVATLIIGDLFDNAFWGTGPVAYALLAIGVIVTWHWIYSFITSRNKKFDSLLSGSNPVLVVKNGNYQKGKMASQRTPESEVLSQMHLQGEDQLKEIHEAYWEPTGKLSVLKRKPAKTAQRKDLEQLRDLFK